jgi:predicted SprT family Zn-dependent metalloprotease
MSYFRITIWTKKKKYQGIRYVETKDVEFAQQHWRKIAKERFTDFVDIEVAMLPRYCNAVKEHIATREKFYKPTS